MAGVAEYKPIKLEKFTTSVDANGDASQTVETYTFWAEVTDNGGGRTQAEGKTNLTNTKTFKIWFRVNQFVNADWRIRYFGQTYSVSNIQRINEKRFNCQITASASYNTLRIDTADAPSGGGGGGSVTNWESVTYNQETGLFSFFGGTGEANTQIAFFAFPYTGFGYVNDWSEAIGSQMISSPGTTTIEQLLTPGMVVVRYRRLLTVAPFTGLTDWTNYNLSVTRLPQRYFVLKNQANFNVLPTSFPVVPLNVNGTQLAQANTIDQYVTIMNADASNAACFTILSYVQNINEIKFLIAPISPFEDYGVWNRQLKIA